MLIDKLQQAQLKALKEKDAETLKCLRYAISQIKYKEIESKKPLSDTEIITSLQKQIKQLQDAIVLFKKAKRNELVLENEKQIDILKSFLPEQIDDKELKDKINELIQSNKDLYERNQKAFIGLAVGKLKTSASPERIVQMLTGLQNDQ